MRTEADLLLRCAAARFDPRQEEKLRVLLRRDIDWNVFLLLASRHRVSSLVYQCFTRCAFSGIPGFVPDTLREIHFRSLAYNLQAAKTLAEITQALEGAGLPVLSYKGPVLALTAYGDLGLRQFRDLDILIRPGDLSRACELLALRGWHPFNQQVFSRPKFATRILRDMVFLNSRGRVPLEVQWRVAQPYHPVFPRPGELWQRQVETRMEDVRLRTFSPEDTLLILCLHGLYHSWAELQMVTDVAEALHGLHPDLERTLDLASRNRAERIFYLGLLLARRLLAVPLPAPVLEKAEADRSAGAAAEDIIRRFFHFEAWPAKARRFFFREAGMFPGLGSRVRYFVGRLLTPNEEDLAGQPLTPLLLVRLPFLRLVRLFRKYALHG